MLDAKRGASPWKRRLRAASIHILGPIAIFAAYLSLSTFFYWHGTLRDLAVVLLILAFNTFSIWTAEWNRNLRFGFRLILTIASVLVLFVLMNVIGFAVRLPHT